MSEPLKKPFSKEDNEKYDIPARAKMKEIFKDCKHLKLVEIIGKEDDKYKVDMQVHRNGKQIGSFELEVKPLDNWTSPNFPFDDVQALPRKQKYDDGKTVWVLFNKDFSQHLIARLREVVRCPTRRRPTRLSNGKLDTFYVVPMDMVKKNGLYDLIKREDIPEPEIVSIIDNPAPVMEEKRG